MLPYRRTKNRSRYSYLSFPLFQKNGAILAPHVDRLPLVSSAIVNVDQDVNEP